MTTLVQGRELTKSYGRHRGILQESFDLAGGVGVPGSQRRRQDVAVRFMVEPVAVGTVPGYVTFRILGLMLPVLPLVRRDLGGIALLGLAPYSSAAPTPQRASCRFEAFNTSAATPMRCDRAL